MNYQNIIIHHSKSALDHSPKHIHDIKGSFPIDQFADVCYPARMRKG